MTETVRAFTSSYEAISNRLINKSVVKNNDDIYEAKTLWDTGATISCISHDVVQKLNLVSTGKRAISTPSGAKEVDTYLVDIKFFSVSNHNGVTVFSFRMPSTGVVDYVKQIKISNIIGEPHGKGKRKKKKYY